MLVKYNKNLYTKLKQIQAIENKYDFVVFRAGLTHLFDTGHNQFNDDFVEKSLAGIIAEEESAKANGKTLFMSADFMRAILHCAAELANFSILTLLAYVKKHLVVNV